MKSEAEAFALGRRRFLAALAGTAVPVVAGGGAALAQKPKAPTPLPSLLPAETPTPTPAPTATPVETSTPAPTATPPPPDEVYARLAVANRFTAPQTVESNGGGEPTLTLHQLADGVAQEWHSNGRKVAHVNSIGLRIFSADANYATDFCDFRNAPDEFGLYNESTHRQPDGTLTNGDIVLYAPWRIRACLKNPHLSNGHFEIREMYEVGPGPIEPEFIPFQIRHGRPAWGSGMHEYMKVKPNFGRMGAASDGYRAINVDLTADAPASVLGLRQLLRLAVAGADKLTVDNAGNLKTAGRIATKATVEPPDADLSAGELALWLDPAPGAPKVRFKAKDSDGNVRTAAVDLQ